MNNFEKLNSVTIQKLLSIRVLVVISIFLCNFRFVCVLMLVVQLRPHKLDS